jgi:hypothetical protein
MVPQSVLFSQQTPEIAVIPQFPLALKVDAMDASHLAGPHPLRGEVLNFFHAGPVILG